MKIINYNYLGSFFLKTFLKQLNSNNEKLIRYIFQFNELFGVKIMFQYFH